MPRLLTGAREMAGNGLDGIGARNRRATMVIADSGGTAEVLVFPVGETVERGARFRYRGTLWRVTATRRDSGILVAEPVTR